DMQAGLHPGWPSYQNQPEPIDGARVAANAVCNPGRWRGPAVYGGQAVAGAAESLRPAGPPTPPLEGGRGIACQPLAAATARTPGAGARRVIPHWRRAIGARHHASALGEYLGRQIVIDMSRAVQLGRLQVAFRAINRAAQTMERLHVRLMCTHAERRSRAVA